jgi:hypothetical protein
VRITVEFWPDPGPWGGRQPKFEHLATDGPDRYFLIGRGESGEQIRVQLTPASFLGEPEN